MSDDLPLAKSARQLTRPPSTVPSRPASQPAARPASATAPPSADTSTETWSRGLSLFWELYFGLTLLSVFLLILVSERDASANTRYALAAVFAAMAVWYLALGRRIVAAHTARWDGMVFQGVLLALFVAALFATNSTSFLLFALCPLAYMTLSAPASHITVILYGFSPAAVYLVSTGNIRSTVAVLVPIGIVSIGGSFAAAITTQRLQRQSAERAVLIDELASSRAEVVRLSREAGVAEERQRLASEIHDTVAQGLSSVVMLVEAADAALARDPEAVRKHLAMAARTARENLDEARAIVGALTPVPLTGASLEDALRRLADRFGAQDGIGASFTTQGMRQPLPTGLEVVLLRVAQESLTNVRKHSAAHTVKVRLTFASDRVTLEIRDDGLGFDPTALHAGYGLGAMRARVEQVGGRLDVRSAPADGTTVRTEIDI